MCFVLSCRAADRYLGLKLKCGTKDSAWVRGTKPGTVPSRGGSSSSDSRRQTDQGARRAMSPEYGEKPPPLRDLKTPDCVQPCWVCSFEMCSDRSSRIWGVHSATSCRAFQNKALLFFCVLFFIALVEIISTLTLCLFLFFFLNKYVWFELKQAFVSFYFSPLFSPFFFRNRKRKPFSSVSLFPLHSLLLQELP